MTTALDIINDSAKLLGVTFKSESLDADEAADGLNLLNDMLDSWSNDNFLTYAYTLESFTMTGAASYTMGTGGTLNTTRPINIVTAVIRVNSVDYPLEIIPPDQFQEQIQVKSISSQIPKYLSSDNEYPLDVIKMYPIPTSGTTLYIQSNKPLANIASLTTDVDLPPGWKRALKYNLAIDMAPQYGTEPSASVVAIAKQSLGAIKRATSMNNAVPLLTDSGGSKRYILGGIT